jgi:PKD domain
VRRARATAIAPFVLLALAPAAAGAAGWSAPFALAPVPASLGGLALSGAGDAFAGWAGPAGAPTARIRTAAGTLGSPRTLGPAATSPTVVASSPKGQAVAAWVDGATARVTFARGTAAGLGAAQSIAVSGTAPDDLAVAIDDDGVVLLAWTDSDVDDDLLVRAAVVAPGDAPKVTTLGGPVEDVTAPAAAMSPSGAALVAWSETASHDSGSSTITDTRVRFSMRTASGDAMPAAATLASATSTESEVNADGDTSISGSDLGAVTAGLDGVGGALVGALRTIYVPGDPSDPDDDAELQRVDAATGSTASGLGALAPVSAAGEDVDDPAIAANAAGDAILTWTSGGGAPAVVASLRAPGAAFGAPIVVATPPAGHEVTAVAPAVRRDGSAVVAFADGDGAGGRTISGALVSPGGAVASQPISAAGDVATTPLASADAIGDALVGWTSGSGPGASATAAVYDGAPPKVEAIEVPGRGRPGEAVRLSVTGGDVWSPFSVSWTFGDGTTAEGSRVSHAFATTGTHTATATLTDTAGNATTATRVITISADGTQGPAQAPAATTPSGPALGAPTGPAGRRRPVVTKATITRTIFRPAPGPSRFASAAAVRRGSALSFSLSEPAKVTITVSRMLAQPRRASRCAQLGAPSRPNAKAIGRVGTLTLDVPGRRASVPFTGRIGAKALSRGRYAIRLQPVNRAGDVGRVRELRVTVC